MTCETKKLITSEAFSFNKIKVCGSTTLEVRGQIEQDVPDIQTGTQKFADYLQKFEGHKVVLVAYNGWRFDFPVLINQLERVKVNGNLKFVFLTIIFNYML